MKSLSALRPATWGVADVWKGKTSAQSSIWGLCLVVKSNEIRNQDGHESVCPDVKSKCDTHLQSNVRVRPARGSPYPQYEDYVGLLSLMRYATRRMLLLERVTWHHRGGGPQQQRETSENWNASDEEFKCFKACDMRSCGVLIDMIRFVQMLSQMRHASGRVKLVPNSGVKNNSYVYIFL